MARSLRPDERKRLLGFGGLKRVADAEGVKEGHISQVNSEKPGRVSYRLRDAIAADILRRHPEGHSCDECSDLPSDFRRHIWATTKAAKRRAIA